MNESTLYILVGLPASGKSTCAERLKENDKNLQVVSSDAIREEFYTVDDQEHNSIVFDIAHKRIRECLQKGLNVVFDATNLTKKSRARCLNSLHGVKCKKVCIVIATPFSDCIANNSKRERQVPVHVIERMRKAFWIPVAGEGFDSVLIYYPNQTVTKTKSDFVTENLQYDQENPHHSLSLGLHCHLAQQKADYSGLDAYNQKVLETACALHDCGKPLTKEWNDSKKYYSYFSHHNVGAYESLFYMSVDPIKVATLINYHMCPYLEWKDSKRCLSRDRKILGEEIFDLIMRLHTADKAAH